MESTEYQNNYENNFDDNSGQNYQNFQNEENNMTSSNKKSTSGQGSNSNSMWYYLSIITWFLFLAIIWTIFLTEQNTLVVRTSHGYESPMNAYLTFTAGFIAIIGTIGFIFYFKKTSLENDKNLFNGMLGDMSKFHSIPLFLISIILILTYSLTKTGVIFEIIFSILAFASLVFIYLQMDFEGQWYIILTTKKGIFSSLIVLSWYLFWAFINLSNLTKDYDDQSKSFLKNSGIAFSLIIGFGVLGFSIFFKDIVALVTNFLIYLGMIQFYYTKDLKEYFGKGCPVIDIIMLIINFGALGYLLLKETDASMRT